MRWQFTVLSLASSLCAVSASAGIIGQAPISRSNVDLAYQITFIGTGMPSAETGFVDAWNVYVAPSMVQSSVDLQVWRPEASTYRLVGKNTVNFTTTGLQNVDIAPAEEIAIQPGDVIGFRYNGGSLTNQVIAFDYTSPQLNWQWTSWPLPAGNVAVGDLLNQPLTSDGQRAYSVQAVVSVPEPASLGMVLMGASSLLMRHRKVM